MRCPLYGVVAIWGVRNRRGRYMGCPLYGVPTIWGGRYMGWSLYGAISGGRYGVSAIKVGRYMVCVGYMEWSLYGVVCYMGCPQ